MNQGKVVAVLDIDSPIVNRFDEIDQQFLLEIAQLYCLYSNLDEL